MTLLLEIALFFGIFQRKSQEVEFRHRRRRHVRYFGFRDQGAELFSSEGQKIGVLTVFKGFRLYQGA